jgi:hypothetical protein
MRRVKETQKKKTRDGKESPTIKGIFELQGSRYSCNEGEVSNEKGVRAGLGPTEGKQCNVKKKVGEK